MRMSDTEALTPQVSYTNLDIAKFICSLLVIMIHTAPFVKYPIAHFYTVNVIARTAVPLFFGISGFLLFGQMSYEKGKLVDCVQNRTRMIRYLKKTIALYLFWAVVYLLLLIPDWYLIGWWGWTAVKDALHAFLIKGMFVHLWYLLAVIWAVPMLYMLLRIISLRKLRFIAVILWIWESLDTTYSWIWGEHIALLTFISEKFPIVFTSTRCALPIMTFGASLVSTRHYSKNTTRLSRFLLVCGMWILEASAIYFSVPNATHFSTLLITPFFVYFTLDYLTSGKQISLPILMQRILRETNTVIYCLHPLLIHLFKKMGIGSGVSLWLYTTFITVGLAYVWATQKSRRTKSRL